MSTFSITNRTSGRYLGTYIADTREGALDAMARSEGFVNYEIRCSVKDKAASDLVVEETTITSIFQVGTRETRYYRTREAAESLVKYIEARSLDLTYQGRSSGQMSPEITEHSVDADEQEWAAGRLTATVRRRELE